MNSERAITPTALATPATASAVMPPPPIRVGLVEDDPVQRSEMSQLLLSDGATQLAGVWENAEEAMAALPSISPDVVLVDIGLPGQSGIALVGCLKPQLPASQFMMLTVCDDTERIFRALAAGATGYLLKKDAPAELLGAIRDLHSGGSPMSSAIARKVVTQLQHPPRAARNVAPAQPVPGPDAPLTPREAEILALLGQGLLYKEIADQLRLGLGTVRTHIRRIYEKLHVHNRTQAVRLGGAA